MISWSVHRGPAGRRSFPYSLCHGYIICVALPYTRKKLIYALASFPHDLYANLLSIPAMSKSTVHVLGNKILEVLDNG